MATVPSSPPRARDTPSLQVDQSDGRRASLAKAAASTTKKHTSPTTPEPLLTRSQPDNGNPSAAIGE